jgi:hypothetical protein
MNKLYQLIYLICLFLVLPTFSDPNISLFRIFLINLKILTKGAYIQITKLTKVSLNPQKGAVLNSDILKIIPVNGWSQFE